VATGSSGLSGIAHEEKLPKHRPSVRMSTLRLIMDAAFGKPELYAALEERDVKYAICLTANYNLERNIAELLTRPVGRPSYKPVVRYRSFFYQAASWNTARRVVAEVEFHFGELFPRVGFIVTNLAAESRAVVRFYNKRGTAE
jgi:hypothetical protein